MEIERKIASMGLWLPDPIRPPQGVVLPFAMVKVVGKRGIISGHGPQNQDGTVAGPFGKVGSDVSVDEAYEAARLTALSMLANIKRELGDLDRVTSWVKVLGMVNSAPEFDRHPSVINGFSDLIHELYGLKRGQHARSAIGVAALPFRICVEVEAEIEID
jgi:enamine deaminase RidA (YjgF/YER057c/UK114 family)